MRVGFDGGIKLEFHGAKVTSNDGLLAYRDLDYTLGLFNSVSAVFLPINAQAVISNMIYPLSYSNRFTAVLQDMKM